MNNIIIGVDNCERCKILKDLAPDLTYIQLPDKNMGFGDTFARWMLILGINKCSACTIRHYKWNKWFPYFWRGDKKTREIRNHMVKLGATEYPVILKEDFSKKIDIDDICPDYAFVLGKNEKIHL